MVESPLTSSQDVTLMKTIQTSQIVENWKDSFHLDITPELCGHSEIKLYQCNQTKLKFFLPHETAGSENLYKHMENFEWYYFPRKWEHNVAIQDLKMCRKVLEVGCGRGAFVDRLCKEEKIEAQGIELNMSAVNFARSQGIPVLPIDLYELANRQAGYFDAICAFQVLEHVINPKNFLTALLKLVKPQGKLIISVPNAESFPKYLQNNLLDQPPHHMTQWCKETFRRLTHILPIQINNFRIEPLAEYHVDWYVSIQASRFPKIRPIQGLTSRVANRVFKPLLTRSALTRAFIPGHTLYVCFEKTI